MPKRPPENSQGSFRVSRRTFLKTVGVGAAATGLVAQGARSAGAAILGPDAVPFTFRVNGVMHTVTVAEPEEVEHFEFSPESACWCARCTGAESIIRCSSPSACRTCWWNWCN